MHAKTWYVCYSHGRNGPLPLPLPLPLPGFGAGFGVHIGLTFSLYPQQVVQSATSVPNNNLQFGSLQALHPSEASQKSCP